MAKKAKAAKARARGKLQSALDCATADQSRKVLRSTLPFDRVCLVHWLMTVHTDKTHSALSNDDTRCMATCTGTRLDEDHLYSTPEVL
jgi:hypothetical protein